MLYSYYVGLDLGQRQDYTAFAVLEEPVWIDEWMATPSNYAYGLGLYDLDKLGPGWSSPAEMQPAVLEQLLAFNYHEGKPPDAPLSLRHLQRFPLGTPYPKIVEGMRDMLATPPLLDRPTALIVDQTGVGQGIVDMLVRADLCPVPVTIHGGDKVTRGPDGALRTPKRDLIGAAQVLMQSERLKIAKRLPEAGTLRQELQNFRVKIDPKTAHDSYSHWREAEHDDLVLATALACWFRQWWNTNLDTDNALTLRR
jgi:hypothetical protein